MPRDDGYASRRELEGLRRRLIALTDMGTTTRTMARRADAASTTGVRIKVVELGVLVAVGTPVDVAVVWSTPMARDTYFVDCTPATGLIGRGTTAVKPGTMTKAGLTITVTASLLVSLGSQFIVIGSC